MAVLQHVKIPFLRKVRLGWIRFDRQSLTTKLVLAIVLGFSLLVILGTAMLENRNSKAIAEISVARALYQSQIIKSKLTETLIKSKESDSEDIKTLLKSIADENLLDEINIFSPEGRVFFSSADSEGAIIAFAGDTLSWQTSDQGIIEFTGEGEDSLMRMIYPVQNLSEEVEGIEILMSLRPLYKQFLVNRLTILGTAILLILFGAFIVRWLVHRIVKRPIKKLMEVMEKTGQGNYDSRIRIHEDPHLRKLALRFNSMVRAIDLASAQIEDQHQRELAQSNRLASLGQYMSNISHEIKNPLAAIGSTLHALRNEYQKQEDQEIFNELTIQIERIEHTVNNLLRYARLPIPSLEKCNLLFCIDEALYFAKNRLQEKQIHTRVKKSQKNIWIIADSGQIQQIFLNLYLNAIAAMSEEGTLTTRVRILDSSVEIQVEDTGKGIPEENYEKIFEPFFSTNPTGTGLGLSVVRGLVEGHGGKIFCDSNPEKGTILFLTLPVREKDFKISEGEAKLEVTQ